jgi:MscS family membrane protein
MQYFLESWHWHVLSVIVGIVALNVTAYYLLRHLERATTRTATVWDDALVKASRKPITLILWTLGATMAIRIVHQHVGVPYFDLVAPSRNVLVVVALAWLAMRLIHQSSANVVALRRAAGEMVDQTTVEALSKLGRGVVVVIAGLSLLDTLGVSITGVLAFGGIGGIAVGFAAKDLFANLLGGLAIYLDRPFSVGEWIRSPDKAIEGTVEHIGWRNTRIRAFNKNPIYVPNAVFSNIVVENPSRMSHRRIKETIGLRYQDIDKVEAVVAEVRAMLKGHPAIDQEAAVVVNFNAFAASSLDIIVFAFTRTIDWAPYQEVKQDVLLKIAAIVARHGAGIAYPTQTLQLESADTKLAPAT